MGLGGLGFRVQGDYRGLGFAVQGHRGSGFRVLSLGIW